MSEQFDFSGLENRVAALERQVAALSAAFAPAARPPAPAPAAARVVTAAPRAPEPAAPLPVEPVPAAFNLEAFFGGRLLLGAGILAFLLGVAFFLKYAFDNGLIGPTGRVSIGLFSGIALVAGSELFQRKAQAQYAQGIAGLGAAVLYLSLWAAGTYFHLLPLGVTFAAMIAVTASVMTVAVRRNARELAFVALAGGLLTPALNSGGPPNVPVLLGYLAVLSAGVLWLTATRWQAFDLIALAGSFAYLGLQVPQTPQWTPLHTTLALFATLYVLEFSTAVILRARRLNEANPLDIIVLLGAGALYYFVMHAMLYEMYRPELSVLCAVLAGAYLTPLRAVPARLRTALAAASLTFLTVFAGVTFHSNTVTQVYLVEGAALIVLGIRVRAPIVRIFGYAAWLLALMSIGNDVPDGPPFMNARFFTFLVAAVSLGCVAFAAHHTGLNEREEYLSPAVESAAHAALILGIALELSNAYHDSPLPASLLMLAYALGLLVYGFVRSRGYARWQGLALFGILLIKVFTVDLATFDAIVRIVSFLAVGVVLLGVAFLYQRSRSRAGEAL